MRKYEGEPDYAAGDYDETGQRFGRGRFLHTVVGWLIIANIAIYVLEIIALHAAPAAFDACFNFLSLAAGGRVLARIRLATADLRLPA